MKGYINHFIKVETIGKFALWINRPICKEYIVGQGMKVINKATGENMGNNLKLYAHLYDANFRKLSEVIRDEDCYTIVEE